MGLFYIAGIKNVDKRQIEIFFPSFVPPDFPSSFLPHILSLLSFPFPCHACRAVSIHLPRFASIHCFLQGGPSQLSFYFFTPFLRVLFPSPRYVRLQFLTCIFSFSLSWIVEIRLENTFAMSRNPVKHY